MKVINARNVHQALPEALHQLRTDSFELDTRNGPAWKSSVPVTTVYRKPLERVMFWSERDANPFFHFMESLWMLAGRRDVDWLQQFNSQISQYSDDGETFHGAYGYRWRYHFQNDQLQTIAEALKVNPRCRRQVLCMWDPRCDLGAHTKDVPCNDLVFFSRGEDGELNMGVCCRSNDIVWGCYGANAVHFAFLQEFMAAAIGCLVGTYSQISWDWHGYVETVVPLLPLADHANHGLTGDWKMHCPYESGHVTPYPLVTTDILTWQQDLGMFISEGASAMGYRDPFFRRVALPLLRAWHAFKDKDSKMKRFEKAQAEVAGCDAEDWKLACTQWLSRRYLKAIDRMGKQEVEA